MDWQVLLIELAKILAYLLAGGFVVPAVNWLKNKAKAEGYSALAVSIVTSALFGIAVVFAEGQVLPSDLTVENLATVFGIIFVAAQTVYRMLEGETQE